MKTKFIPLKALACILLILIPNYYFSQTDGPFPPSITQNQPPTTCTTCAGAVWNSTFNVTADDDIYSNVQLLNFLNCYPGFCYQSRYLASYNFGFSIPNNAIITGIKLVVSGYSDMNFSVFDSTIKLMSNYTTVGDNRASLVPWGINDSVHIYGGESDLWGMNWDPQLINNPSFGVFFKVYNPTNNTPSVFIDAVSITVNYSIGTSVFSQSSFPKPLEIIYSSAGNDLLIKFNLPEGENGACMKIYDCLGKEFFARIAETNSNGTGEIHFNTSNLNKGIYFIALETSDKIYTAKTVVSK